MSQFIQPESSLDRRRFLSAAAASTVALGASSLLAQDSEAGKDAAGEPAKKNPSANDTIVLGIMGTNGRGTDLAHGFARERGCEIAYVCDVDERAIGKAQQAVESSSAKRRPEGVTDFRKILDDKAVDALVVAAPDHWHAPATILACTAGKHVYCEKPCCHNPREGELMVQAARKHNRVVQLGTQRRSTPAVMEAIEQVRKGAIGRVLFGRSVVQQPAAVDRPRHSGAGPRVARLRAVARPGARAAVPRQLRALQLALVLALGHRRAGQQRHPWARRVPLGPGRRLPDARHGRRRQVSLRRRSGDARHAHRDLRLRRQVARSGRGGVGARAASKANQFGMAFYGDEGTLVVGDDSYKIYDMQNKESKAGGRPGGEFHLANFLDCIRSGKRPNADIEEGHKSTLLCHLGNIAYRTGRVLSIDPQNGHIKNDAEAEALWRREYRSGWEPQV